jgi:tetratricopeptide (TPR) repeat protein
LPGSPLVLTNLSAALEATGDITAALAAVDRALAATPAAESALLHNRAGLLSLRLGLRSVAVGHFEAALQVSPGFAEARANLERARK